jgi:hypothetical protein
LARTDPGVIYARNDTIGFKCAGVQVVFSVLTWRDHLIDSLHEFEV